MEVAKKPNQEEGRCDGEAERESDHQAEIEVSTGQGEEADDWKPHEPHDSRVVHLMPEKPGQSLLTCIAPQEVVQ